ncbi:hypothetical protein BS47DRAFT_1308825, partial [Hydnum rufescens UP504]
CEDSYLAAKDYRIRVSKEHADKGLIVLVCRHDHVIWFINMGPNGEKWYFMLMMIQKLLGELPESFTVGFFYDIICAMHREMERWQLLPQCLPHLKFSTPMFHSYGHQWPCQLSYHPYKNPEFGHTDGEGCEREWNLLNGIIPIHTKMLGLQFHRCLFVINNKQAHVDEQNHINLASRLKRHFDDATAKLEEAECTLEKLMIPVDDIKAAWAEQLSTQQAEPPCLFISFVLTTFTDNGSLGPEKDAAAALHDPSSLYCHELLNQLNQLRTSLEKIELQLAKKESDLLLHSKMTRADLDKIKSSQWYDALIHTRAHYHRLVSALVGHKFTITQCIEDYRSHTLDHKAHLHEAKADKKQQPAIMRCLEQLNKQIQRMLDNWDDAPPGAIPPETLDWKGLFSLDINGVIWKGLHVLKAGLGDDHVPPRWLADENMRVAIIAYLDLEGCQVELDIIKWEVTNIHVWYTEEYNAIRAAIHKASMDIKLHCILLILITLCRNRSRSLIPSFT